MNPKIEIASHRGVPYPDNGRPIALYREQHARSFFYMLLMPGEPGHDAMLVLTEDFENVGGGMPRVITDTATVRDVWPECPLVTAIDAISGTGERR